MPAPSGVVSDADELVNLEERGGVRAFVVVVVRRPGAAPRPLGLLLDLGLDLEDGQDVPVRWKDKSCLAAGPCLPNSPITQLSPYLTRNAGMRIWVTSNDAVDFASSPYLQYPRLR